MKWVIAKSYARVIAITGLADYSKSRNPCEARPGIFSGRMKTIKMLVLALCAALLLLAAIRPVQVLAAQPHGWNAGDNLSRSILHPIGWISLTIGYAGSGGAEGDVTAVDTAQPAAFGLLISLAGALILALGVFVLSRRKA